jgi:hypothetical protein
MPLVRVSDASVRKAFDICFQIATKVPRSDQSIATILSAELDG